jgi:uncharacterized UBP type Zn finger protein
VTCAHTEPFDAPHYAEPEPGHTEECEDCVAAGEKVWAHLRLCLTCGHVGCCDSSPHRHAERHWKDTGHPVMRSFEPGESWRWCYPDERIV